MSPHFGGTSGVRGLVTGLTNDVINSYVAPSSQAARRVALFMLGVICARRPPVLGM
jgi:hypothetical protein